MDNQQVTNTTIEETSVDTAETVKTAESETPKLYTEEEYSKGMKSASSKAKNDILKDLGITSVKDFSILKTTYEAAIKENDSLKKEKVDLSERLVLRGLNVKSNVESDFISLAKNRISDSKDFDTAAKEVAGLYPNMLNGLDLPSMKVGTEKKENTTNSVVYSEELLKRYPQLHGRTKI